MAVSSICFSLTSLPERQLLLEGSMSSGSSSIPKSVRSFTEESARGRISTGLREFDATGEMRMAHSCAISLAGLYHIEYLSMAEIG